MKTNAKFFEALAEKRAILVPTCDENVKISYDGAICIRTNTPNGKEWLGWKNGKKVAYDETLLLDGVYGHIVYKDLNDVAPGMVVKETSSTYSTVNKVENGKLYTTTFGGNLREDTPAVDFVTGRAKVAVVVSPIGDNCLSTEELKALVDQAQEDED